MESGHVVCVICNQDLDEKTIKFTTRILDKSISILKIRKKHNLKYNNISLPEEVTDNTGYHVKCYKNFIAVMKKYYQNEPSTLSSVPASLAEMCDVETEAISSSVVIEESKASTSGEASLSESSHDKLCIFCTNKYKRVKWRFQALHSSETESLLQILIAFGEDNEFYQKVIKPRTSLLEKYKRWNNDIEDEQLEKDVSNYTKHKMGYSQRLAKGMEPTKFENRKRLGDASASTLITKRPKTGQSQESDDNISNTDEDNSDVENDDSETTDSISEYIYSDDDVSSVSSDLDSPATLKVCRICLAMNVKMYHMSENNLSSLYEIITGGEINTDDKLPQMLCWECVSRLSSCKTFIEKAQKTQWILKNMTQEDKFITINDVKSINKDENGLNSTLSTKVYNVNNANLHIIEEIVQNDDNCKNAETQTKEYATFIKTENSDEEDEIHNIQNQEGKRCIDKEEYIEDEIKIEENVIEEPVSFGVGIDPLKNEQAYEGDEESITNEEAGMNIEKEQCIENEIKIEEDVIQDPVSCGVGIYPVKSEQEDEGDEEFITIEKAASEPLTPSECGTYSEVVQNNYRLRDNKV